MFRDSKLGRVGTTAMLVIPRKEEEDVSFVGEIVWF